MILIKHQKSCSSFQPSARLDDGRIRVSVWVRRCRGALCLGWQSHSLLSHEPEVRIDKFKDWRRKENNYNSNCRMKEVVDQSHWCSYSLNGKMALKQPLFNILPVNGFTQAPVFTIPVPRSSNLVINLINPRSAASTLLWLPEVTRFYWPDDLWGKWLRVFGGDIEGKIQKSISFHFLLLL